MAASDISNLEVAAMEQLQGLSSKVIEQVAFYLSPANLQRDVFLTTKLREGGGFVHATLLAGFPRIKSIVEDTDAVCNLLWNSSEFNCKGSGSTHAFYKNKSLRFLHCCNTCVRCQFQVLAKCPLILPFLPCLLDPSVLLI